MRIPFLKKEKVENKKSKSFVSVLPDTQWYTPYDLNVSMSVYKKYADWVAKCVALIADEVSNADFTLYKGRGDKKTAVDSHKVIEMLRYPNPETTTAELLEYISSYLDIDGNAFLNIAGDRELWVVRPDRMKVNISKGNERFVDGYTYLNGASKDGIPLDVDEVVHFKLFNPFYDKSGRGLGVIGRSASLLDSNNKMLKWNDEKLEKGETPRVYAEYPDEMDEDEVDKFARRFKSNFMGTKNVGNIPILQNDIKLHEVTTRLNHRDIEYIAQRKMTRDDVFGLFGVPKGILLSDDVNLANAQTALWTFARFTIRNRLKRIEATLNNQLVRQYAGDDYYIEFDNPVPEDRELTIKEYKELHNVIYTTNELRQREGLDPVDGGDEMAQPTRQIEFVAGDREPEKEDEEKMLTSRKERGEAQWHDMMKIISVKEGIYKQTIATYFEQQEDRVIEMLKMRKAIKTTTRDIFNNERELELFIDVFSDLEIDFLEDEATRQLRKIDVDETFVLSDKTKRSIEKYAKELGISINDITIAKIENILEEYEEDGVDVIATKLQVMYNGFKKDRAEVIARTESIKTSNQAMIEAWKQSGVVVAKQWYTAEDERVCNICIEKDGATIPLDDNFNKIGDEVAGYKVDFRDIGEPPIHPNCRCTMLPIIK